MGEGEAGAASIYKQVTLNRGYCHGTSPNFDEIEIKHDKGFIFKDLIRYVLMLGTRNGAYLSLGATPDLFFLILSALTKSLRYHGNPRWG